MQPKHNRITLNRYTVGALVLLVVLGVTLGIVVAKRSRTEATAPPTSPSTVAVQSQFSFNTADAPGWRKGPTNKTSLAAFHDNGCFISVEHKTGTVDVAVELQKMQDSLTGDGYTVAPGSVQTLTIQTTAGQQQYELHQSTVATPAGANKVMGAQEFGYLQLPNGYVKAQGYCNSSDQLPTTLPALQAIEFDGAS